MVAPCFYAALLWVFLERCDLGLGVVYKTPIRHILLKKLENPALAVSIQEAADAGKF
jgi:hypothetical protein